MFLIGSFTFFDSNQIVRLFSQDAVVIEITTGMLEFYAIFQLFDGMQTYAQGPILALGLQNSASYFSLGSFYVIGVPLALLLSIKLDYGVLGL